MDEDISTKDNAIKDGVGWGMTLKSFVPFACHFSQSTTKKKDDTSPTKIIDVQPPVPPVVINPPPNTTTNNEWLHFSIMVLLEGKHGKIQYIYLYVHISCAYLMHLCISYAPLCISLSLNLS